MRLVSSSEDPNVLQSIRMINWLDKVVLEENMTLVIGDKRSALAARSEYVDLRREGDSIGKMQQKLLLGIRQFTPGNCIFDIRGVDGDDQRCHDLLELCRIARLMGLNVEVLSGDDDSTWNTRIKALDEAVNSVAYVIGQPEI